MSKIILKKAGKGFKPFETEEEAFAYIDEKFEGKGTIIELDGGFGVQEQKNKVSAMKYFWCEIAPRSSETDQHVVPLGVNGHIIQVTRGQRVILPESHIEVAENAKRIEYVQKGNATVPVGTISVCPCVRGEETTEKEFRTFLKKGNDIRDRDLDEMNRNAV